MGFGKRSDFTANKEAAEVPAADYNHHINSSLAETSRKKNPKTMNGFFNKFDAYEKICYPGMEQFFYGKDSPGPGTHMTQDFYITSKNSNSSKFSVPKANRGVTGSPSPRKYLAG